MLIYEITRHISVGRNKNAQCVYGKVLHVTSREKGRSKQWKQLLQLEGREIEAKIYDPMYLDIEKQGERFNPENRDNWPITIYNRARLESSQSRFLSDTTPMQALSEITPAGQSSPIVNRPYLCRLFHPSRELVSERACPVMLVIEMKGVPVSDVVNHPDPARKATITSNIMETYRLILDSNIQFGEFLPSVRVRDDGSLFVCEWKDCFVQKLPQGMEEEWTRYSHDCIHNLKHEMEKLGLRWDSKRLL